MNYKWFFVVVEIDVQDFVMDYISKDYIIVYYKFATMTTTYLSANLLPRFHSKRKSSSNANILINLPICAIISFKLEFNFKINVWKIDRELWTNYFLIYSPFCQTSDLKQYCAFFTISFVTFKLFDQFEWSMKEVYAKLNYLQHCLIL